MKSVLPLLSGSLLFAVLSAPTPLFAGLDAAGSEVPAAGKKPNILLIAADDLNHWVGYTGRNKQTITTNIDRLSARGVSFANAHASVPVCNASRASLMSGLRPWTTGIYDNSADWRPVIAPEKTLITTFKTAGYITLGSGKIYHGGFDRITEWDDYLQNEGKLGPQPEGSKGVGGIRFGVIEAEDSELSDHNIVNYGISQLGKSHDKPFLLTVGLHKPHMPWFVPKKYFDLHPLDSIQLPPTKEKDLDDVPAVGVKFAGAEGDHKCILESGRWKEAVQAYLAAVSYADAEIGRLLDALDSSAHKDNTIVVLFGDHGWHFGEKEHWRKFALWEESTRAPLIWYVPGLTKGGTISTRPVDFISLFPTLTELAGIPAPAHLEGPSLRPLLADPAAEWKHAAISTWLPNNHSIRTEDWRYTRYADGGEELYDHRADPYEWTNLAGKAEFADKKTELAKFLPAENAPSRGKGNPRGGEGDGGGKNRKR